MRDAAAKLSDALLEAGEEKESTLDARVESGEEKESTLDARVESGEEKESTLDARVESRARKRTRRWNPARRRANANANANAHTYTHAGAKRRHVPLDVAVDAAAARLSYLWRSAESREAEARRLLAAEEKSSEANEAQRSPPPDARAHTLAADLAAAEVNLAEARATATTRRTRRARRRRRKGARDGVSLRESATTPPPRGRNSTPAKRPRGGSRASAEEALAAHRGEQQSGQARALMLQAEAAELRAKVEKRNREVRELNQCSRRGEEERCDTQR